MLDIGFSQAFAGCGSSVKGVGQLSTAVGDVRTGGFNGAAEVCGLLLKKKSRKLV
jgi:hypothetical protein